MKRFLSALLVAAALLCLCGCSSEPTETVHNDVLDTLMAVRYEGKSEELTKLAPQAYWDWYENQGRSIDELLSYSKGIYYSWVNSMTAQFGSDLKVTYTVTEETVMDSQTFAAIVSALESQYGMDSNTITGGKVLTVSMTITGSASSDTMPSEYMLITVSGSDYPVLLDDSGDELVVTFRT